MKITDFDFSLPENLIAKRPLKERSSSRLLVLHRDGAVEHNNFSDIPSYLDKEDMLIINNTKVFPARLTGLKKNGGMIEILLVKKLNDTLWEVLSRGKYTGSLKVSDDLQVELHDGKTAQMRYSGDIKEIIWKNGNMPLPPYIKRLPDESDKKTYQTVFAKEEGSIAAPTAGLHFTDTLLKEISSKGIRVRELTLHVGIGTFSPIRTEHVEEHSMDTEYFEIDKKLISEIKETKAFGKRVVSVGTTTTRALEGYMSGQYNNGSNPPNPPFLKVGTTRNRGGKGGLQNSKNLQGTTDIFIYPGYTFQVIDSLITNFHLPRSTPLMLASAFCGWGNLMKAYKEAIVRGYRFLSYGDAMLIL